MYVAVATTMLGVIEVEGRRPASIPMKSDGRFVPNEDVVAEVKELLEH